MFRKCISIAVLTIGVLAMVVAVVAQQGPTEAPTGFDTPTLAQDPGSQSVSNDIAEPPGDTYASTKPVLNKTMMPGPGWAPYSTPERARIVTKILSAAAPVNSRRSVPVTTMPAAIS
jgi:hypothetical protein